jgi:O-antigen ligase
VVLALAVLVLVPWAVRHTSPTTVRSAIFAVGAVLLFAVVSGVSGADPSAAATVIALALAAAAVIWLASRTPPSPTAVRLLALGVSMLAVWAAWQVGWGFERAQSEVAGLPLSMQDNAIDRLDSGRAFASLVVPGHLAALLATALPLLMSGVRRSWSAALWIVGCGLCVMGLVLTYSPVGIALATVAAVTVAARGRRRLAAAAAAVLLAGLVTAFVARPELSALEPLRLRADNWRTALWVWSTSPIAGVGLGGYGQASQTVPFAVGNRPAHAHSLPLEWLSELGLVGAAAVLMAGWTLLVLVRRLWQVRPELAVAVVVVPLHNLLDFSLYTSGVAIPWAVLVGWGLAVTGRPAEQTTERGARMLVVAASAVALAVAVLHSTSVIVEPHHLSDAATRFDDATAAHRLAPWRVEPVAAAVAAALESGDSTRLAEADRMLASSRWLRPRSGVLASLAGRLDLAAGKVPSAVGEARTAVMVQPYEDNHGRHLEALIDQLRGTDRGPSP